MIQPSQAICVSSHTPVSECVRLMRSRNVGSLLIMSPSRPDELQGIFTERDLLKWIDQIQHGGHWQKPVAHLMSRPVVTLSMDRLHEAAALMASKHIRHLPIVQGSPQGLRRVLGIVSMRDLFLQQTRATKSSLFKKPPRVRKNRVLFFCDDHPARKAEARSLGHWTSGVWQTRRLGPLSTEDLEEIETADLAVIDLDGVPARTWAPFLKQLNAMPEAPLAILMLTESTHSSQAVTTLKSLSKAGKWPTFSKPVALVEFLRSVQAALQDTLND